MDLFSSNAEESINKVLICTPCVEALSTHEELVEKFKLKECVQFITEFGFSKVCLQFPDILLQFSVEISIWIEKQINQKVFILGDTSYASCCVDEIAAQHVEGDAIIHFGHACLSPTTRLPVFYVLPRATVNVCQLTSALTEHCSKSSGPVLLLYDVAFHHIIDEISEELRDCVGLVISQLAIPQSSTRLCGPTCASQETGTHNTTLLGHRFCCPDPESVVYITYQCAQNMLNLALTLRNVPFFTFSSKGMENVDFNKTLRRRLYLVEKIKDAKTLGILVCTLSVDKYLGAIERVKSLTKLRGKRCYIFCVGKPNPAKLANFPEIEIFVLLSCPEACLEGEKEYLQPVVTLLEVELALHPERQWADCLSLNFRDLLEGGTYYKPLPEGKDPLPVDISLIDNKIRCDTEVPDSDSSTQLSSKENYQISIANMYNAGRSWRGLEQALGETPVTKAVMGRSGIPLAYENERYNE